MLAVRRQQEGVLNLRRLDEIEDDARRAGAEDAVPQPRDEAGRHGRIGRIPGEFRQIQHHPVRILQREQPVGHRFREIEDHARTRRLIADANGSDLRHGLDGTRYEKPAEQQQATQEPRNTPHGTTVSNVTRE